MRNSRTAKTKAAFSFKLSGNITELSMLLLDYRLQEETVEDRVHQA